MTYGQPTPPPGPQSASSPVQAILAPTAAPNQKSLIAGGAAAIAGLLLIVFAFLSWATISVDEKQSIGNAELGISLQLDLTGMGKASVDTDLSLPDTVPAELREQIRSSANFNASDIENAENGPGKPGIWMIIFGVLLFVGGALVIVRKFPGIGAVIATAAGIAATIAAIVFLSDPVGALGGDVKDTPAGAAADTGAGYGLWLTLVASLVALAAGAFVLLQTVKPGALGGSAPAVPASFGGAPGFPPAAPQGPAQGGFGQPGYPQPGFGQQPPQPGYPQQGFPPAPPQG